VIHFFLINFTTSLSQFLERFLTNEQLANGNKAILAFSVALNPDIRRIRRVSFVFSLNGFVRLPPREKALPRKGINGCLFSMNVGEQMIKA
jgi:hypothetical protein